jgi:hypothetical protein
MNELLFLILAFGAGAALWTDSRRAAELARQLGLEACTRSGVQLLDQSVSLHRIALRRAASGWLQLLREYHFEYSRDGTDRNRGGLALQGNRLVWVSVPEPRAEPA